MKGASSTIAGAIALLFGAACDRPSRANEPPAPLATAIASAGPSIAELAVAPSAVSVSSSAPSASASIEPPDGPRTGHAFTFRLASGYQPKYPDVPNVWAYVPAGFDPASREMHVVVILHGYSNCVTSFVSKDGLACPPRRQKRTGYDLPVQIDRAGTSALVVVPQLEYDERSSDPHELGDPDGLKKLLTELIETALTPTIGKHSFSEVNRVAVMAASGGYQALFPLVAHGGVDFDEMYLLDAMYFFQGTIERWLVDHVPEFTPKAARPRRMQLIYCSNAGTEEQSIWYGETAQTQMKAHDQEPYVVFDQNPRAKIEVSDLTPPVAILHAAVEHDAVTREHLWKFLAASGI